MLSAQVSAQETDQGSTAHQCRLAPKPLRFNTPASLVRKVRDRDERVRTFNERWRANVQRAGDRHFASRRGGREGARHVDVSHATLDSVRLVRARRRVLPEEGVFSSVDNHAAAPVRSRSCTDGCTVLRANGRGRRRCRTSRIRRQEVAASRGHEPAPSTSMLTPRMATSHTMTSHMMTSVSPTATIRPGSQRLGFCRMPYVSWPNGRRQLSVKRHSACCVVLHRTQAQASTSTAQEVC